jgi:hypothetical protein
VEQESISIACYNRKEEKKKMTGDKTQIKTAANSVNKLEELRNT